MTTDQTTLLIQRGNSFFDLRVVQDKKYPVQITIKSSETRELSLKQLKNIKKILSVLIDEIEESRRAP